MKIGYPNHPRLDLVQEIEWTGENGFGFLDLFIEEDQAVPEKIDVDSAKASIKKHGLGIVGHTACYLPFGSAIPALRKAACDEVIASLPVFRELGAKYVTVHGNWPVSFFSVKEGIDFQVESLTCLVDAARDSGVEIMYEHIESRRDRLQVVVEIMNNVPGLLFHLDVGHVNVGRKDPSKFIERFADRLIHVHFSDNNGLSDQHLPLGCGTVDWERVVDCLKQHYDGTITLEVFTKDRDYLLMSKSKLEELWKGE